jgi:hypothetical protein
LDSRCQQLSKILPAIALVAHRPCLVSCFWNSLISRASFSDMPRSGEFAVQISKVFGCSDYFWQIIYSRCKMSDIPLNLIGKYLCDRTLHVSQINKPKYGKFLSSTFASGIKELLIIFCLCLLPHAVPRNRRRRLLAKEGRRRGLLSSKGRQRGWEGGEERSRARLPAWGGSRWGGARRPIQMRSGIGASGGNKVEKRISERNAGAGPPLLETSCWV